MDPILGVLDGVIIARGILNLSFDDNRYCLATAQLPLEYVSTNLSSVFFQKLTVRRVKN